MNWLPIVINFYVIEIIVLVAVILFSWFIYDKRFRKSHGQDIPSGYERTDEISIDPTTGKRFRVYYDPKNGSRYYHEEK